MSWRMSSVRVLAALSSVVLICALVAIVHEGEAAEGENPTQQPASQDDERKIEEALNQRGNWEFIDTPLVDVVDFLKGTTDVDFVIDSRALEDYGIPDDTPVTMSLKGTRLRSFLNHTLRHLDLTWTLSNGALLITTPEECESQLIVRVYPVTDLLPARRIAEIPDYDYDALINLVSSTIQPDSWDNVGGPGSIEGVYGALAFAQTRNVHEQIKQLFAGLRRLQQDSHDQSKSARTPCILGVADNDKILDALNRRLTLDFVEVPLHDMLDYISEKCDLPIVVDTHALDDFGIDSDCPVTLSVVDLPLRQALNRAFHSLDITWTVDDEALVVTTPEESEARLSIALYPVADLVIAPAAGEHNPWAHEFDSLINVITSCVVPDSWDAVGGPGSVEVFSKTPTLVIAQTGDIQELIHDLLAQLRQAKAAQLEAIANQPAESESATPEIRLEVYRQKGNPIIPIEDVMSLIVAVVEPRSWGGEDVLIRPVGNTLVIRHTDRVHRQVQQLLTRLQAWDGGGMGGFGGGMGGFGGGGFGGGMGGGKGGGFFDVPPKP